MGAQQRGRAFTLSALPGADLRGGSVRGRRQAQARRVGTPATGKGTDRLDWGTGLRRAGGLSLYQSPELVGQGPVGEDARSWPLMSAAGPELTVALAGPGTVRPAEWESANLGTRATLMNLVNACACRPSVKQCVAD